MCILTLVFCFSYLSIAAAEDAARLVTLDQDLPTLHCLGFRCLIEGDANHNAHCAVSYRKEGKEEWATGHNFLPVNRAGIRPEIAPLATQQLHAGSIVGLQEDTHYEVRIDLVDPDGGAEQRILQTRTWSEPPLPKKAKVIQVSAKPGALAKALKDVRPGTILQLDAGIYEGTFEFPSGAPDMPIVLMGPADGDAVFDGRGASNCISGNNIKHVMFERLHFRNAKWLMACNGGSHLTIRSCHFSDCDYAFVAQKHGERQQRIFISDCVMKGDASWPRTDGIESKRGIQLGGTGHVVCHNRISHFADAIDTFNAYPCAAIDIYRNEISECTDDGIELDYSDCNNRVYENRLTNVYQGISLQPIHGGPVYVFRNVIYNVVVETFKMHNEPYGAYIYHNSSIKSGMPLVLMVNNPVHDMFVKNNLFIGSSGNYAYENTAQMNNCIFEHNAFIGQWKQLLKWNGKRYADLAEAQADGLFMHTLVLSDNKEFKSGLQVPDDSNVAYEISVNNMSLHKKSRLVDKAVLIPNFNHGFADEAPDMGAIEYGADPVPYGPRQ